MRVTFNTTFRDGLEDVTAAAQRLAEWQRQVSSSRRVQTPSDDPSAAAQVVNERAEMAQLDQYRETTDSVEARLRVVDTLLSDMLTNLTNVQTTAAAGRSTILKPEQRQALALQLRGTRDALLLDVNSQFRGSYLFSGTATLTAPFTRDPSGTVQPYGGTSTVQQLDIDTTRSVEVTVDGGAVAGNLFDVLEDLAGAIEAGDMTTIEAGIQQVNAAFERVTNAQSRVGAVLGDVDAHRLRLDALSRASDARRSSLEDANLAEAISRMQQADTAYQAALSALGTIGRLSLMDYLR
jgi:flagellar hook-associated protein 3 FlgL